MQVDAQTRVQGSTLREYLIATGVVIFVAWAAEFAVPLVGYRAIAWVFLAVVVVMAAFVGRGATLMAAILSALIWDFFFEQPLYSFYIASMEDRILFVTYLVVAVTLGELVAQIRVQEKAERERQERATTLQLLTRELTEAAGFDEMLKAAARYIDGIFGAEVAILLPSPSGVLQVHSASAFNLSREQHMAAALVFQSREAAGPPTTDLLTAPILYFPLIHGRTEGVIGLRFKELHAPSAHLQDLTKAFCLEIAGAIQRYRLQDLAEKSKLLAESERLSKTLLNSISHEIRTPLAAIQSATTNMIEFGGRSLSDSQKTMVAEVQVAADRLDRLVGKVLDMTRLESGRVRPKFVLCEVSELVMMAEAETRKEMAHHKLAVNVAPDLPPVPMDFELMLHSLTNLLSNAAFHTPIGTEVRLTAALDGQTFLLAVADRGPGIPPEFLAHIFEKFYRAPTARTGGTGLGLSLVKGFVEAHGGTVTAENRAEGGAAFSIRMPLNQPSTVV